MKKRLSFGLAVLFVTFILVPSRSRSFLQSSIVNTLVGRNIENQTTTSNSKTLGPYRFEMIFQPAKKRIRIANGGVTPSKAELKEAEKLLCYELRVSHESEADILQISNEYSFEDRVLYFSTELQRNLKMIIGKDTMSCVLYHFERNFGIAPYLSLHAGFESPQNWKKQPHHLVITDKYFHFGEIHLENRVNPF